ncbi:response regulator transcription factor [Streptococcus sp. CF4-2]|uniref:response regulator transcription factor n=1 Tax=unclassified Streptococcus TaxID=2608887 RepID=UPI0020CA0480|nr:MULTISPECIES: response regulator transcription factor [unclassified Streptococcus]MCP9075549.1 response regulator transcription factor [Streptococcus sp. CF4-3]MCP9088362.1 response regulator transcription factor [Streptococcus sp. CF4-2]
MARILIVEDNNEIQEILRTLLSEEHEVIQAFSGTEGMIRFEQGDIDLILLDIMLPGKNGDQVLKLIRQDSSVPVIMLTALSDKKLISQYLLDGANDYIVKPFDLDEVFARVMVQLRQNSDKQAAEIEHPDKLFHQLKNIQFDVDSFEIKNSQETIRLAKKECLILQTLLRHPKKIFTKEELYELVWEDTYLPGDNTLNTHLSNLRKKLSQLDPEQEYIETIWGVGVRLKGDEQ